MAAGIVLLCACGESAPAAVPLPPSPPPVASPQTAGPTLPPAPGEPAEPFDFWRTITEPDAHVGQVRMCVVTRVTRQPPEARFLHPTLATRPTCTVTCRRRAGGDAVAIVVALPPDAETIVASERDRWAPDIETQLRVRVVGLDPRGETPNTEYVGVHRVQLEGDNDPTQPPSRCCRERRRPPEMEPAQIEVHPGFDFAHWARHVGTEQLCVVAAGLRPQRVDAAHPPVNRVPADVVVQMHASCTSTERGHHLRLFFTPETAASALRVERHSFVRGRIGSDGSLRVHSVGPMPRHYEAVVTGRQPRGSTP